MVIASVTPSILRTKEICSDSVLVTGTGDKVMYRLGRVRGVRGVRPLMETRSCPGSHREGQGCTGCQTLRSEASLREMLSGDYCESN